MGFYASEVVGLETAIRDELVKHGLIKPEATTETTTGLTPEQSGDVAPNHTGDTPTQ